MQREEHVRIIDNFIWSAIRKSERSSSLNLDGQVRNEPKFIPNKVGSQKLWILLTIPWELSQFIKFEILKAVKTQFQIGDTGG